MKKIILLALIAFGCNGQRENSDIKGIIGDNNLAKTSENSNKQGLLQITNGRDCNAFLIAANQVATTLHCVGEDPQSFIGYKFTTINGESTEVVDASYIDDSKDMIVYLTQKSFDHFYVIASIDKSSKAKIAAFDHEMGK